MKLTIEQFDALLDYIDARIDEKTTEGDSLIESIRSRQLREDALELLTTDTKEGRSNG